MSNKFESPFSKRYASNEMQFIFSDDNKFSTWRKLWIALAESEQELGLNITDEQIAELKDHVSDINYETAKKFELELRHDVMAHIRAYGEQCPKAKSILHLGATSCYVGDNTDLIIQKTALMQIKKMLVNAVDKLAIFAEKFKNIPTLAYTHFQSAQPTTVGKRACLWLQDLMFDLDQIDFVIGNLKLLGCKGTTGTQASFLELFDGDEQKVLELDKKIAEKMGFESVYSVSGQTYSRKIDYFILSVLSGICQSASKFSNDIRLLSHLKEVDEPFEEKQVGSSAMAYKRNPMRSERIASLSRLVCIDALNPAFTACSQWFERTLDDSANKRITTSEAFLATDSILSLYINIISGLKIYPNMMQKHLMEELPFMATENILMSAVKKGGDRQALHELIREYSVECARAIKQDGKDNELLSKICGDKSFKITEEELKELLDVKKFTGMAEKQTEQYLKEVKTYLGLNKELLGLDIKIKV